MTEFLRLVQGNKTVMEYESRFTALSLFAPDYVKTEKERTKRFVHGLRDEIQKMVATTTPQSFKEALHRGQESEAVEKRVYNNLALSKPYTSNRGNSERFNGSHFKKPRFGGYNGKFTQSGVSSNAPRPSTNVTPTNAPSASIIKNGATHKTHFYPARQNQNKGSFGSKPSTSAPVTNTIQQPRKLCFLCGQPGHFKAQCRNKPSGSQISVAQPRRNEAHAIIPQDNEENRRLVAGIFLFAAKPCIP